MKHYFSSLYPPFLFTILCFAAVCALSFFRPSQMPIPGVPGIDKWTHAVMYLGLTACFWFDYHLHTLRRHTPFAPDLLLFCGFLLPVLIGGIIEICQAHFTGGWRSGEMADFVADTLGVIIACLLSPLLHRLATAITKAK